MDFIYAFLKKFLPTVSDKNHKQFSEILSEKKYKKNDIITEIGEIPTKFYLLKSGVVASIIIDNKGTEHIKTLYTPITSSGALSSLIKQTPSDTYYQCLTDCEIIEGNFHNFIELTKRKHIFAILYYKVLEHVFIRTEDKMKNLAILNATERYLELKRRIPNIENLIPQYHIASYLNITPVQLSRIRKGIYSK